MSDQETTNIGHAFHCLDYVLIMLHRLGLFSKETNFNIEYKQISLCVIKYVKL